MQVSPYHKMVSCRSRAVFVLEAYWCRRKKCQMDKEWDVDIQKDAKGDQTLTGLGGLEHYSTIVMHASAPGVSGSLRPSIPLWGVMCCQLKARRGRPIPHSGDPMSHTS